MMRFVRILLIAVIALVVVIGGRWYQYITNTTSPYDEVGISLNNYMPVPIRQWGCAQLKKNFGNNLPPYGCSGGDGRQWL